jgi:hypothetical protein
MVFKYHFVILTYEIAAFVRNGKVPARVSGCPGSRFKVEIRALKSINSRRPAERTGWNCDAVDVDQVKSRHRTTALAVNDLHGCDKAKI